jgi:P-type Ca2+ transporter type 2C
MVNQIELNTIDGLSEVEVKHKLKQEGYNKLPDSQQRSILAIAWEVVQEPIFVD